MKITEFNEGNIILNTIKDAEVEVKTAMEIPAGYLEVRLSTQGKVGAPAVIHVRNFKVSDIVTLAMSSDNEIASRLANVLNTMVFEDVNVSTWHEKEVEELMVYIFKTFYKSTLDEVDLPLSKEDYEELAKDPEKLEEVKSHKWVPKTSININRDVETYDIPKDFKSKVTIKNKKTGFYCTFDYIHYGDQIVIQRWLDSYFAEEEARFKPLKNQIQFNANLIKGAEKDPEILNRIIKYDPEEEKDYNEYLVERLKVLSEIAKIISITDYNGLDISKLSVGEKYDLLKDEARIDYGMISKLNNKQLKMKFGIKSEVSMYDPILGEVVKRPFSFRLATILQAMQLSGLDDYDDGDDD